MLAANLALTQALLLLLGVAGSVLVSGVSSGDWRDALLGLGWARNIAQAILKMDPTAALLLGLALATAFSLIGWMLERMAWREDDGQAVIEARRGINGELPRMGTALVVLLMVMVGCAEELLFRYVALGGVGIVLCLFMPSGVAALCALVFSSFAFWLAHVRYRDFYSSAAVLVIAVALGIAYLGTGSLLLVAVAHGAYDLADVLIERHRMETEPDYFRGPAPTRVVLDMMEQAEKDDDGGDAS